ncbi:TPA: hypothetical protein R4Z40_002596 [Klebsiella variicola subsp. variicola]|nr:hypothetical protein [Klebsiella variicola subsp. variicola]
MAPKKQENSSIVDKLVIPTILALLVGGSAPWWWSELFKNNHDEKQQSKIINVTDENQNTQVVNGAIVKNPSHTVKTQKISSYLPVWQCIPPAYRPVNGDLESLKPNSFQLNSALLDMVFMGEMGCTQTLLDAGANVNAYRYPAKNDFGDGPSLHLALNQKNWAMALYLLQRGADTNLRSSFKHESALQMARESLAPPDVINVLQKLGAK